MSWAKSPASLKPAPTAGLKWFQSVDRMYGPDLGCIAESRSSDVADAIAVTDAQRGHTERCQLEGEAACHCGAAGFDAGVEVLYGA